MEQTESFFTELGVHALNAFLALKSSKANINRFVSLQTNYSLKDSHMKYFFDTHQFDFCKFIG